MFRSVALCCGARAVGVILTGTLGDGACGLARHHGGAGPRRRGFSRHASGGVASVTTRRGARSARHAGALEVVHEPAGAPVPVSKEIKHEVEIAKGAASAIHNMYRMRRAVGAPGRRDVGNG
jgi:two-component system chemotaxis response regulator CheB